LSDNFRDLKKEAEAMKGEDARSEVAMKNYPSSKWLVACEIMSLVSSVVVAEWAVMPFTGRGAELMFAGMLPVAAAFALMLFSRKVHGETWREVGIRFDNFWRALRLLLIPMLLAALLLFALGLLLPKLEYGVPRVRKTPAWIFVWGIGWGFLQQFMLQGFVNRRAQMLFGKGFRSVLVVALVFALLHMPNPWLTVATFCGGLLWAFVYQRTPNLFALALSHSLMTWLLIATIPDALLHGLRVGYNYF
jgi:membrane protease YdiL (CAAX protease family)